MTEKAAPGPGSAAPVVRSGARTDDAVGLSIVVPAYNEEGLIVHTVEHLLKTGRQWVDDLEIIVVNDGSTDRTPQIIDGLAEKYDIVRVFHQNPNRGFGATVRQGYKNATKAYVMVCPVDYLFTLEDFDIYLALIKYSDIVIGYRRHRRLDLPFRRRLISTAYHIIINLLFGLNFFDVNWIHMYRRDKLSVFVGNSNGVFLLAENIIQAKRRGLKIVGVDVNYLDRTAGVATGIMPKTILKTVWELVVFFFKQSRA